MPKSVSLRIVACLVLLSCSASCLRFQESLLDGSTLVGALLTSLMDRALKPPACGTFDHAQQITGGHAQTIANNYSSLGILQSVSGIGPAESFVHLAGCRATQLLRVNGTDTSTYIYQIGLSGRMELAIVTNTFTITYAYKPSGHLGEFGFGCFNTPAQRTVFSLAYDSAFRLSSMVQTTPAACNAPTETAESTSTVFGYGDPNFPNWPTQQVIVSPAGTTTVTDALTAIGTQLATLVRLSDDGTTTSTTTSTFVYSGEKVLSRTVDDTVNTGTYTFTYDTAGRVTGIHEANGGSTDTRSATFTYKANGNIDSGSVVNGTETDTLIFFGN